VAGQYILWKIFQPSSFGVFIILSIHLFLRQRPFLSVLCLGAAVTLHFTYVLGAAVLIATYMGVVWIGERNLKKALLLGALAALVLAPVTVHVLTHFGPTSREAWGRAQDILANIQLPRHAKPANWLGTGAGIKVALIVLALVVVRKTRLFPVMLVSLLVGVVLTVVQIVTGSNSLAMLFPWRVSVYLVPISTCVLGCWIGSWVWDRLCREDARNVGRIAWISRAAIVVFVLTGLIGMGLRPYFEKKDDSTPVMDFARNNRASGETYLVPVELRTFRLNTGAPIVVDCISIPYKDTDVLEWYARFLIVKCFYGTNGPLDAAMLKRIAETYKVTHVVLRNPAEGESDHLKELYRDEKYTVCRLRIPP
jgi:hypothetical protein